MQYIDLKSLKKEEILGDSRHLDYAAAGYFEIVPLKTDNQDIITFAVKKEMDIETYLKLRFLLKREILFCKVDSDLYSSLLQNTWSDEQKKSDVRFSKKDSFKAKVFSESKNGNEKGVTRIKLENTHAGIPAVQLVDDIFSRAISAGASDIHLEPGEDSLGVRFRLDGVLQPALKIEKSRQDELLSRLKILAKMDIAEKRLPQDGRFKMKASGRSIDIRVSVLPTIYGEKIVMRILDAAAANHNLDEIGFEPKLLKEFKAIAEQPHGIIIVTGPTGSGKSTTLYSALNYLRDPKINITTVEDPVEYRLAGINQVQVKPEINLDFASCLRAILRQDPDIVLIGEIRDKETVEIAIKASLTGHLVLSTFHTNDAPSAISRLMYMGIEPYLLGSTLNLVVAQRLVRRICEKCKEETTLADDVLKRLKIDPVKAKNTKFYHGKGCSSCGDTGYRGRLPIFEFLVVDSEMRQKITVEASEPEIRTLARQKGYGGLLESGVIKILQGLTTAEEVLSTTFAEDIIVEQ